MNEWITISDEDAFNRLVLAARHPVVVAFESDGCRHCREHRFLLSLAWRQLGWKLTTALLDVMSVPGLAARYRVITSPTVIVFSCGRIIERYPGGLAAASLTHQLADLVTATPRPGTRAAAGNRPLLETVGDGACRCCA